MKQSEMKKGGGGTFVEWSIKKSSRELREHFSFYSPLLILRFLSVIKKKNLIVFLRPKITIRNETLKNDEEKDWNSF